MSKNRPRPSVCLEILRGVDIRPLDPNAATAFELGYYFGFSMVLRGAMSWPVDGWATRKIVPMLRRATFEPATTSVRSRE